MGLTNLSVTASGAPLNYVWIKNGAVLPGATHSVLSFPNIVNTNVGTYSVIVSNFLNSVNSVTATVNLGSPSPTITTQPQSQAVAVGNPVTFSVVATNVTAATLGARTVSLSPGRSRTTSSSVMAESRWQLHRRRDQVPAVPSPAAWRC